MSSELEGTLIEACMVTEAVSPDDDPRTVIRNLIQWHVDMDRVELGRSRATHVRVKNVQAGGRIYNEIKIDIGGLHMRCQVSDGHGGDRDIRLAKRIADDHAALFWHDDMNADRCKAALANIGPTP